MNSLAQMVGGDSVRVSGVNNRSVVPNQASLQVLPFGTELLRQDLPPNEVYFLRRGLVKLYRLEADGREVFVALRAPGWILGLDAALLQRPSPVTASAITECHVHRLHTTQFLKLVEADAAFACSLLRLLSEEFYDDVGRRTQLSTPAARTRLLQFFSQFLPEGPVRVGKEVTLDIPLKEGDIAGYLAIHPSTLSKIYKKLEAEGVIRRHKGRTIIKRMDVVLPHVDPIHTAWKLPGGDLVVHQNRS